MIKVISIDKNNLMTVEMDKEEENIFFRYGLQCFLQKDKKTKGKLKVLPPNKEILEKMGKNVKTYEMEEELAEEFIKEGIIQALRSSIKQQKKNKKRGDGRVV